MWEQADHALSAGHMVLFQNFEVPGGVYLREPTGKILRAFFLVLKSQKAAKIAIQEAQAADANEQPIPPAPPTSASNGPAPMETGPSASYTEPIVKQEPPEHNGMNSEFMSHDGHVTILFVTSNVVLSHVTLLHISFHRHKACIDSCK